jgi:hypothetical protein
MGGSASSSVKMVDNKVIVNQTDIDIINQQMTTVATNTIVKNAQQNMSTLVQSQKINISDIISGGNVTIAGGTQDTSSTVSFSGINEIETYNDTAGQIYSTIMTALQTTADTSALSQMVANAQSTMNTGALSMPSFATSNATTDTASNTNIDTKTKISLQNIVSNTISNNFTQENVSSCINAVNNTQSVDIRRIDAKGDVSIGVLDQKLATTMITQCLNKSETMNKILNSLAANTGVTVATASTAAAVVKQEAAAAGSTVNKGLLEDIGEMFSGVYGGIATVVGVSASSCLCCLCMILLLIMFMYKGSSSD